MTSRREFLRLAAGGVAAASLPWGCGSNRSSSTKAAAKTSANGAKRPTSGSRDPRNDSVS
ncbi:MAG TPA: twin-arginine translocation signal domain-containing protein [Acidimicrobiia bacterium]|nr:twin-arginine translocation signal domain-containing protein [Acidimicrobiia bacterium]